MPEKINYHTYLSIRVQLSDPAVTNSISWLCGRRIIALITISVCDDPSDCTSLGIGDVPIRATPSCGSHERTKLYLPIRQSLLSVIKVPSVGFF
ncbi:hypothetical protein AVEN_166693-1 [Araneus ventricosus]|uniref:Uncharacterized protein n=1 Tax=Araneus ventricosus TaxID=182803 RepID=A0A4Y2KFB6_ARAVE|nr:hypothetical protein AVEN_166693-1 [Araneus ventricosus]